jgi:hypothetical protein
LPEENTFVVAARDSIPAPRATTAQNRGRARGTSSNRGRGRARGATHHSHLQGVEEGQEELLKLYLPQMQAHHSHLQGVEKKEPREKHTK